MRVISGHARGIRLTSPKTDAIRPTTDRIREALFSSLGDLTDCCVVDLFSGSGASITDFLHRCRERNYIELNSFIRRRLHTLYAGFDIASRHMHWIVFAAVCARRAALRTRSRSSMIV